MEIPRHWRIRKQRYSMIGATCPNCENKMFPAREVCPQCGHGSQAASHITQAEVLFPQGASVSAHILRP